MMICLIIHMLKLLLLGSNNRCGEESFLSPLVGASLSPSFAWGFLLEYLYPVIEYDSSSGLVWSKQFLMGYKIYSLLRRKKRTFKSHYKIEQIFLKNAPSVSLESFSQTNNKINVLLRAHSGWYGRWDQI